MWSASFFFTDAGGIFLGDQDACRGPFNRWAIWEFKVVQLCITFQEVEGRGGLYKLLNAMKNVNFSQANSRQGETLVLVLRR